MWMRSAPATASDGEAATRAPNCSRGRAFDSVRFHTVTCSPRRSMPSTIPLPSSPVPMNATFAMRILPLQSIAMRRLTHCLFVAIVAAALGDRPARAGHYPGVEHAAVEAGHSLTPERTAAAGENPAEAGLHARVDRAAVEAGPSPGLRDAAEPPAILRWAGDPEGGAPFVEADPSHPETVVGFDVEIADLLARGLHRTAEFLNVTFTSIDQS